MSWTKAASRLPERKRSGQGRPGQGRQIEHMLYQFRSSGSRLHPPPKLDMRTQSCPKAQALQKKHQSNQALIPKLPFLTVLDCYCTLLPSKSCCNASSTRLGALNLLSPPRFLLVPSVLNSARPSKSRSADRARSFFVVPKALSGCLCLASTPHLTYVG